MLRWRACVFGFVAVVSLSLLGAATARAETVRIGDATAPSTAIAWSYYESQVITSPSCGSGACSSDEILARTAHALGDDIDRIFLFVHDEIDVVPIFGVQNGARGALIDMAGTPFDQTHLFVELARAAGYEAAYVVGAVRLSSSEVQNWFGTSSTAALEVLADGGFPVDVDGADFIIMHMWARVTIAEVDYYFDPARKNYEAVAGAMTLAELDTAMGFTASNFMSEALSGSTTGNQPSITNINRDNIRDELQDYSEALLDEIETEYADAELAGVIGGRDIVSYAEQHEIEPEYPLRDDVEGPRETDEVPQCTSTLPTTYCWRGIYTGDVPSVFRVRLTFTVLGAPTPAPVWFLDQVYGQELTIEPMREFPQQGQGQVTYRFYRNGEDVFQQDLVGADGGLTVTFNHPYAASGGAYMDGNAFGGGALQPGAIQFIVGGGRMSPNFGAYLESRSTGSEGYTSILPTLGEERAITNGQRATKRRFAASFATQFGAATGMLEQLSDGTVSVHSIFAVARTVSYLEADGEVPITSIGTLTVRVGVSANADSGVAADTQALRRAIASVGATLEGSAVEQNLDSVSPISTAARFDWVAEDPEDDYPTFYIATTANWTTVRALLVDNDSYPGFEMRDTAEGLVNAGYTVIIPRASDLGPGPHDINICAPAPPGPGCLAPGPERGYAMIGLRGDEIVHYLTASNTFLAGGGGTDDAEVNPVRIFSIPEDFLERQFTTRAEAYNVDLGTGAVTYTPPPDIVVGEGAYPYSLSYQRSYRSSTPYDLVARTLPDSGWQIWQEMFRDTGWTSNWMAEARMQNDGDRAFGQQSPRDATDTIAALRVLLVLSADQTTQTATLQRQVSGMLTLGWWREQLVYNAINIVHGPDSRSFFQRADGAFAAPPGDATEVTLYGEREIYEPVALGGRAPRWWYRYMCVRADNPDGSTSYYGTWNPGYTACATSGVVPPPWIGTPWMRFRRQEFREGVIVSFDDYTLSNNLGRSITYVPGSAEIRDGENPTRFIEFVPDTITTQTDGPGSIAVQGTDGEVWTYDGSEAERWRVFAPSSDTNAIVTFTYNDLNNDAGSVIGVVRGQVAALADAVDNTARYHISAGRVAAVSDPTQPSSNVIATRTYFDEYAQPIRVVNRLGYESRSEYDVFRRVIGSTRPEGNREEYEYDTRNNRILTRRIGAPGSGLASTQTSATYDTLCNMPLTQTDALGNVTTYTLLSNRCLISSMEQPAVDDGTTGSSSLVNPETTYTWNSFGQLLTRTDPTDREVRNAYNSTSRYLQTVTVENGGSDIVTTFGRDSVGNITSVTDPRGYVHTGEYDASRRLIRYLGPSGTDAETKWTYNPDGLVTLIEQATGDTGDPWSATTYAYLPTGRVARVTDPDGNITQYSYDALNRTDCVAVRMNPAVYGSLPSSACTLSTQGSQGPDRISRTVYDAEGQVLEELRAYGTGIQIAYATREWTANGQLNWVRDANDNRSALVYDGFGRLCRLYFPVGTLGADAANTGGIAEDDLTCASGGTNPDYEGYEYNANDNRVALRLRSTQIINYTYDALNREILKDIPSGTSADVTSRYDLAGRRTFARFSTDLTPSNDCTASNSGIDYCYDTVGRPRYETSYGRRLAFQYDQSSNRTRITHPDNAYFVYTYDALNRVDQVQRLGSASGLNLIADYDYDAMSRRSTLSREETGGNGVTTYDYSEASRLTDLAHDFDDAAQDVSWAFGYNPAGQVTSRTFTPLYELPLSTQTTAYTSNGLNQYSVVGGVSFGYTGDDGARGNLTSDGVRSFDYDLENRLLNVTRTGLDRDITYDPLGRVHTVEEGTQTWEFVYDGDRLVLEYNVSGGAVGRRYVHGPGVDEPLIWYEGSNNADPRWLIADRQGSIIATTNSSGAVTPYAYGPYGEPQEWGGVTSGTRLSRFRYTGQAAVPELQLYHYKARVYDPVLGRFLQTDPVGYADNQNLYIYVQDDPLNLTDPSGRETLYERMLMQRGARRATNGDRQRRSAGRSGSAGEPPADTTAGRAAQVAGAISDGRELQTAASAAAYRAAGGSPTNTGVIIRGMGWVAAPIVVAGEGARVYDEVEAGEDPVASGYASGTRLGAAGLGGLVGTELGGPWLGLIGAVAGGLMGEPFAEAVREHVQPGNEACRDTLTGCIPDEPDGRE